MKAWIADAIDQIALGEALATSTLGCGQRFGLIAVDNSVEFMLIAYIEVYKRLVGGHIAGGIPKKQWESQKQNFSDLLAVVVAKENALSNHEVEINRYHDLRNDLYHTGKPRTVSKSKVLAYAKLAREVMDILFSISYDETEWEEAIENVQASFRGESEGAKPRRSVEFGESNGVVKCITQADPTAKEAILLALYGYSVTHGKHPTRDELSKSLAMSGTAVSSIVLSSRLYELRRDKMIRKNDLALTAKGKKEIATEFILP